LDLKHFLFPLLSAQLCVLLTLLVLNQFYNNEISIKSN